MDKNSGNDIKRRNKRTIHVHPDFYGVYLLRSIPKPRSFYIGSTPNPKRRLRQHNGELKNGGAFRTKKTGFRPWEMISLVYNFPSKSAALQFEHALQHPYQTRHIKQEERITQKKNSGNTLHHKLGNIRLLLASLFFKRMGLKVLIFDPDVYSVWNINKLRIEMADDIQVTLANFKEYFNCGNEDVSDLNIKTDNDWENTYFESCKKALLFDTERCLICEKIIDYQPESLASQNQLDIDTFLKHGNMPLLAICYYDGCQAVYHLSCLGSMFLEDGASGEKSQDGVKYLTPLHGKCPSCKNFVNWSKLCRMSTKVREYFLKGSFDLCPASQFEENETDN